MCGLIQLGNFLFLGSILATLLDGQISFGQLNGHLLVLCVNMRKAEGGDFNAQDFDAVLSARIVELGRPLVFDLGKALALFFERINVSDA